MILLYCINFNSFSFNIVAWLTQSRVKDEDFGSISDFEVAVGGKGK